MALFLTPKPDPHRGISLRIHTIGTATVEIVNRNFLVSPYEIRDSEPRTHDPRVPTKPVVVERVVDRRLQPQREPASSEVPDADGEPHNGLSPNARGDFSTTAGFADREASIRSHVPPKLG